MFPPQEDDGRGSLQLRRRVEEWSFSGRNTKGDEADSGSLLKKSKLRTSVGGGVKNSGIFANGDLEYDVLLLSTTVDEGAVRKGE
jgi:hypothetical protein